jgi:hypothetical protein
MAGIAVPVAVAASDKLEVALCASEADRSSFIAAASAARPAA